MKHKSKLDKFIATNYANVTTVNTDSEEKEKQQLNNEKKPEEKDESDKLWNALGTMAQINLTVQNINPDSQNNKE
ncbi:MAG: hypothetical protein AB1782_02005 [Cyanobacteriota bacterium]